MLAFRLAQAQATPRYTYGYKKSTVLISLLNSVILLIAVYQLADGIQNVSVGILRGIQDVKIIMPIAFLSYIVFNLPVGYLLGFTLGMGAQGLILGFTVGLTTAAVLLIVRYRRDIRRWKAGIR
jgi:MATE family multidrug resistance protein